MKLGTGDNIYEWVGDWAKVPDTDSARRGWAHPGIVVTESGDVVTHHAGDSTVMVFGADGNLKHSWDSGVVDGHDIALANDSNEEYLWIADNGSKRSHLHAYDDPPGVGGKVVGKAVKKTLTGETVLTLGPPDLPVYQEGDFMPTSVAVNEERYGGNGDVWVADGYGQNYVHRFDRSGNYISSINGEEGTAGKFATPHGVMVDRRKSQPELYVADRANNQGQVYDLEGNFKRAFGSDYLVTPCGFVASGDNLIVAELRARVAVLDIDDKLVCYLGANEPVTDVDGWPNNNDEAGAPIRTSVLEPGKFNSPHGVAADPDGNIYVAEWLIGGRFTKLAKL